MKIPLPLRRFAQVVGSKRTSGFVADGLQRLLLSPEFQAKRAAVEAQVREEHATELARASDYWQRLAIEEQIDREIRRRVDSFTPSPYALWTSR